MSIDDKVRELAEKVGASMAPDAGTPGSSALRFELKEQVTSDGHRFSAEILDLTRIDIPADEYDPVTFTFANGRVGYSRTIEEGFELIHRLLDKDPAIEGAKNLRLGAAMVRAEITRDGVTRVGFRILAP